jgi:hypothetical protein
VLTYLVLAGLAALIYLFKLDSSGFSMSEGHRVVPGLQMLQDHDWFMPHMFGQAYLRKPPGMPWAIAASVSLLGNTVFAARFVSALSMFIASCASAHFARRWFGSGAGLAAGLTHLLLPWFFESGRAAEIESLNNCATAVATWAAIDLLVNFRAARPLFSMLLCTLGCTVAALAKGPASLPVILAACVAACLTLRSARTLLQPRVLVTVLATCATLGVFAYQLMSRKHAEPGFIVTQGVDEFLWAASKVPQILTLPMAFLVYALPASLALLPALRDQYMPEPQRLVARSLARTVLLSVLVYACSGISNPRYTLPAGAVLSPLIPFALQSWAAEAARGGRLALLARGLVRAAPTAAFLLIFAGIGYASASETRRAASSGMDAGTRLALRLPDHSTLIANDMIEARPEVLLYAEAEARKQGKSLVPRWLPAITIEKLDALHESEIYVLLRTDEGSDELARLTAAGVMSRLAITTYTAEVGSGNRPFRCMLYRYRRP